MRRLSQHFLVNRSLCRKIVSLADLAPTDRVLEIGPGRGALTEFLLAGAGEVWVIELDRQLSRQLASRFGHHQHLTIIESDALRYSYERLSGPFKVVANLPYAIASPLLLRLLERRQAIPLMVLMFQREVAERLVAQPGGRQYGVLTIFTQLYADVSLRMIVSPGSFRPRPKVESAIVTVTPRPQLRIRVTDENEFIKLVRAAFTHRRKTIRNGLLFAGLSSDACRLALQRASIDPQRRPESLTLEDWGRLSNVCTECGVNF